ncbi:unnamed protein product [Arabis nemorensis]|uniref:Uncharacterized protein n=1 Tax=Arabis nemorensis TaxID=586526 RepID=A0A565C9Q7_9BRAS|nr:unnamed protein product [Arabis nemorensis]
MTKVMVDCTMRMLVEWRNQRSVDQKCFVPFLPEKLRDEIFKECGKDNTPDSDIFSRLKLITLELMESLRPAIFPPRSIKRFEA